MDPFSTQYHDVFNGEGRLDKKFYLEIDDTVELVRQPVRIPLAMKSKLKEELAHPEKIWVINPVNTPTDLVSSLVLRNWMASWVYIDPKPLNKALKCSHSPLPVIEDLFPDLSRGKVFSTWRKNGYWHVELDEASSYLNLWHSTWALVLVFPCIRTECFQHCLD